MGFRRVNLFRRLAPRYGPHYGVAAQGYLRGLGLIYVLSFWSLAAQAVALGGPGGLQPIGALLSWFGQQTEAAPLWFPSLFWISREPFFMLAVLGAGTVAGLCMLYGFLPWFAGLLAWVSWVSLVQVFQPWLSTPGDFLLAEMGLFALLLIHPLRRHYPPPDEMASRVTGMVLLNLLLCKVLFSSALAKLAGPDSSWADSTALYHFFETQPLPSAVAWYAHHLPETLLKYLLWGVMFVELVLPFYAALPRTFRNILAGGVVLEALVLLLTGHHGFLPLQLALLGFVLVDDVSWRRLLPEGWGPRAATSLHRPGLAGVLLLIVLLPTLLLQAVGAVMPPWRQVEALLGRAHGSNRYAIMSDVPEARYELSLQGSLDGKQWIEYRFKLKPTDPASLPNFSILHLPRLDQQFTELAQRVGSGGNRTPPVWLFRLAENLLEGDRATLSLFPVNPFPDPPPNFLRLALYEYRFADPVTRREKGLWWRREFRGFYGPAFRRQAAGTL